MATKKKAAAKKAAKKKAPVKKSAPKKKADIIPGQQAWERGEGVECGKDESE